MFAIGRFVSFVSQYTFDGNSNHKKEGVTLLHRCEGACWVVPIGRPSASLKQRKKCSTTSKSDPADSKRGPSDQGRLTCMKPIRRVLHFGSWWYRGGSLPLKVVCNFISVQEWDFRRSKLGRKFSGAFWLIFLFTYFVTKSKGKR